LEKLENIDTFELELLYLKDGARLTHKPTKASASIDELTELIAACVQVSFGVMEQSDE